MKSSSVSGKSNLLFVQNKSPLSLSLILHKIENTQGLNRVLYCFSFELNQFCYKRFTEGTSSSFFHVDPFLRINGIQCT